MTVPKFEIVRTVVNATSRTLDIKYTIEKPIEYIYVNTIIAGDFVPKWKLHKKSSLMLDREIYMRQLDTDGYLDEVQAWCQETGNGRRTSYDTFHFSKPAKMTAFLLRWNNG